jgi:hypothetical protein
MNNILEEIRAALSQQTHFNLVNPGPAIAS